MSTNVFAQFDANPEAPENTSGGNVFEQFDEPAAKGAQTGNVFEQFDKPAGAGGESDAQTRAANGGSGKSDGRIQQLMDGWSEVTQQPEFQRGGWKERQRLRGDYIDSSQIRRLNGSEYDAVFGPFMNATSSDVFGSNEAPGLRMDPLESTDKPVEPLALPEEGEQVPTQQANREQPGQAPDAMPGGAMMTAQRGLDPYSMSVPVEDAAGEDVTESVDREKTGLSRSVAAGAIASVAATSKGAGEAIQQADIQAADRKVDSAERRLNNMKQKRDTAIQEAPDDQRDDIAARYSGEIERREEALGQAMEDWADREPLKTADWLRKRGVDLGEVAEKIDVEAGDRTWRNDVAGGVGSMLSFLGGGLFAKAITRGSKMAAGGTAVGMASSAGVSETYDRAIAAGLDEDEALERSMAGVLPGAVQVAPLASVIKPLPKKLQGKAIGQLYGVLRTGGSEAAVEGAGAILQNIIEKGYNPEKGTLDDVGYRAAIGGGSGAAVQAGTQALTAGKGMGAKRDQQRRDSDEAPQVDPSGAEAVTTGLKDIPGQTEGERAEPRAESQAGDDAAGVDETSTDEVGAREGSASVDVGRDASDLIRTPRHELTSEKRSARDSLTYGNTFKALRKSAKDSNDSQAVADLDAVSEEVSNLLETETLARSRGESLEPVRKRLDLVANQFESVEQRINGRDNENIQTDDTLQSRVENAAGETDTSPTAGQAEAGNYRKGKVRLGGFEVAIENPKGSTRSGTDESGQVWENRMGGHYGDIKGTEGADGDNLDVFVGDNPSSSRVYVVDQVDEGGAFDETKTLMGYDSLEDARQAYLSSYDEGWQGLGEITETTMGDFRQWVREGNTRAPFRMPQESASATAGSTQGGKQGNRPGAPDEAAQKRRETTYLPDNTPVDTEFRVVDLADLTPSNRADGQVNPDFPAELQPRDRTNTNSQVQVSNIAARLNPERLGSSPDAGTGAPIVGRDGVVESGNGRTMAIANAYKQGGQRAQQYRDYVQQQAQERGVDANMDGMRRPVLVRERATDMDRAEFARRSNESQVAGMTSYEQAMADADAMSSDDLSAWTPDQSGDPLAASNRDFQRNFVSRLGNNEAARYTTRRGQAAPELGQRMSRAVFAKAYSAPDMVEMVTEQGDQMRNLAGALQAAAPDFAMVRETGHQESIDTIEAVNEAVRLVRASRRDGVSIRELTEQTDAFSEPVPEVVGQMAMLLNTNMRSRATLESALTYISNDARRRAETALNGALFEDTTTSEDVIREGFKRNTEGGTLRGAEAESSGSAGESAGEPAGRREAGDTQGAPEAQAVTLRPDGTPFQTRRAAELSRAYRDTPGAAAVEVEGGWGFTVPAEESAPLLETYTEQDLAQREQDTARAEQAEAEQARQEAERAQADQDRNDFLLTGSDRTADVAAARGQDPLFAFAGESAQGADQRALGTARERIESGESPETVRQETGWFQGADERWRFEISDDGAAFLPFVDGSAGELWTKSLDEVIDHPRLFAAYPSLRDIDVLSADGMGRKRGQYSAGRNEILINSRMDAMDQLSTLLHEVQHGIQHAEGFATGGRPESYRLPPMRERWLKDRVQAMERESAEYARDVMESYRAGELTADQAQQQIQQRADETGLNDMRRKLREGDERGAFRQYQRLAGEIEARNVQARQGMSETERREASPLDTADVPQNEAVVVYNGEALEQAPPPANADPAVPPNGAPYVSEVSRRMAGRPELAGVQSVQSVTELPASVLDAMEARGVDAGKVAGAYDPATGESFVVADNLMDAEEGVRRAVHEAVGHQGIHGVLGDRIEKVMTQVYQSYRRSGPGNVTLREIQRAYPHLDPETEAGRMGIAEELVARSIERTDGRPALRERVMAAIRDALRAVFPGVTWTDADIRVLGERSRRHMAGRQTRADRNPNDPAARMGLRSVVRGGRGAGGVSARDAQGVVDAFMERYQGNVPLDVRVAATQEELYGPQATVANVGRLKGAYHPARGVMTIVASNANSVRDIQRTLRHEVLGHYGLNTFKSAEKRAVLDRILETQGSRGMAEAWDTVRRNYPDAPRDIQAEEVFAHAAEMERGTLGQAWDRVLTGLQKAVRVTGLSRAPLRLSELHDLARQISEGIQEGSRTQQTRPATDDAQFSRESDDGAQVRFSLKDEQPESVSGPYGPNDSTGFSLPDESWVDAKLRVWADKMRPLKRLGRAIEAAGGTVEEDADPYLTEELYHGRLESDLESFRHSHVEPLADGLAKSGISQASLDEYVYALHAPERNAVVAERNPNDETIQDGGSGMTNAEAAGIIEQVARSGKQAEYDRLAQIVHDITALRRDAIRDGGLETDDVMDAWQSTYQHYVPLKGFANDEPEAPRIGKGFQITGKESFMVKGRRDRAASPSTQAIVDANMAMIRRRKNEVGNAFLSMATDHPNQDLWEVFTDERPDSERATVRVTDPETGGKKWEVRDRPVQMARDDRYFKTKRAGRTYYVKVKDQRLLNAMRNVGPESNYWITRVAGSASRIMSSLMTSYNPEFLVTNFERDVQTALLNVGAEQTRDDGKIKGKRILRDTARDVRPAMRAAWRGFSRSKASGKPQVQEWDQWFNEFIEDGAKTGHFDMKDVDAQAKEIAAMVRRADGKTLSQMLKARKKTADFVENINGAVENGVRLSAYANARRSGLSRKQAASLAKNLTVNFNRRGEIGTGLNAAYMFANASIQGSMNFARVMVTLKDTPAHKSPMNVWARANLGQKIGFGMAGAAFAMASLNRWLSDEDDDGVLFWDKVPDHVKERHYVLMTGWITGNPEDYVKIPLPYGYNVFAVAGTHAEAVAAGTESPTKAGKELGLAVAGSFSPIGWEDSDSLSGLMAKNFMPTLARSTVQLGWNEDFAGRLIYREEDPYGIPSPESSRYMRSTPEAYKDVARVLNDITGGTQHISGGVDLNPDVLQHLVNYYGGGAWSFAEKTANFAQRTVTGQDVENYRVPFAGKVFSNVTPYKDQSLFYQRRDELGQIFKEAESLGGKEGTDFRKKNRERIGLYLTAVDIAANLADLRKDRDAIEVSEGLDDATKRKRIESIEAEIKAQVDRFNRQYNELPE